MLVLLGYTSIETVIVQPSIKLDVMNVFGRDYRINEVNIDIDSTNHNMIIVNESIRYHLKGCFREIFRDLRDTTGFGVTLGRVSAYCEPECEFVHENNELIGRYGEICNQDPVLYTSITYHNVTQRVSDAYELHYTLWGGVWDRLARVLRGTIILPQDTNEAEVYFRPYGQVVEYEVIDNVVVFESLNVKGPFEIIIAYGRGDNTGSIGRQEVEERQSLYEQNSQRELSYSLYPIIFAIIMIVIVPIIIFYNYGREPQTSKVSFTRDPPNDMKPYKTNLLSMGQTGSITSEAISATILDLALRKHIVIEEVRTKDGRPIKDVYMTFKQRDDDILSIPEKMIYDFFYSIADIVKNRPSRVLSLNPQASKIASQVIFWVLFALFGFPIIIGLSVFSGAITGSASVGGLIFVALIGLTIYGYTRIDWEAKDIPTGQEGDENRIKWSQIERELRMSTTLGLKFQKLEKELKKEIQKEVGLDEYYDNKGYIISRIVLLLGIIFSGFSLYWMLSSDWLYRPVQFDGLITLSVLLLIIGIVLLSLPNRVFGRFSDKGIQAHNRIVGFRKFITDFSSLKRYPPSSLAIWDEIIVYATALGCAKNVEKHMRSLVGDNARTPVSRAASIGMASRMSRSVRSSSSSGGGGRGGGRAGGGGGGAR